MLLVRGIVKGIKQTERVDQKTGQLYQQHFVGIASPTKGGYDGEETLTEIKISDKFLKQGHAALYQGLRGQEVTVPVFPQQWVGKNGPQISWFFSEDGLPVKPQQPEPVRLGAGAGK